IPPRPCIGTWGLLADLSDPTAHQRSPSLDFTMALSGARTCAESGGEASLEVSRRAVGRPRSTKGANFRARRSGGIAAKDLRRLCLRPFHGVTVSVTGSSPPGDPASLWRGSYSIAA